MFLGERHIECDHLVQKQRKHPTGFCWGVQGWSMLLRVTSEIERESCTQCPHCELLNIVKNGRDRRGAQVYYCADCHRNFTVLTGTPFSGHSFPPAVIGLAVRWYLR